ncbi:MAG: NAD-dependent epimerase/dehydratase family protein [Anaerolineae bacterium]
MTRALITGVTGCVGSNLAVALASRGIEVVGLCQPGASTLAIDRLPLTRIGGDIADTDVLRQAMQNVDWVFHVAAIADDWRHSADKIYRVNVGGTENVLAAALEAGVQRFVLTSSAATLGVPQAGQALLHESCEFNLRPRDWVYAHSKVLAEQALQSAVSRGLHAVSVLPTAIFGPADMSFISGQLIVRAWRGEVFPFPNGGANYVDVRDVAEAQIQAALSGEPGERYLLGGHNLSHLHCLGTIGDVIGMPVRYLLVPGAAMPGLAQVVRLLRRAGIRTPIDPQRIRMSHQYMYYDNARAVRALGLAPRPFDVTIEDTYRWYRDHGVLPGKVKRGAVPATLRPTPQGG